MQGAIQNFAIPQDRVFTDPEKCLAATKPDLVILCPATADHAAYVERVAPFGVNMLLEKPFAASIAEADRMIAAAKASGKLLASELAARLVSAAHHHQAHDRRGRDRRGYRGAFL